MQHQLRTCFEHWGLPKALRVDNGSPWATQSDIPSALALWLVGLGVKVIVNRPGQSTDNGIVERDHGVLAGWVEPHQAHSLPDFQKQLDWAQQMQREGYPAIKGTTRLETYPGLRTNARRYARAQEQGFWQMQRVLDYLATRLWIRRVDQVGRISLFSTAYSVGRAYKRQSVTIHLDARTRHWVIESEQGQLLKCYPCLEIVPERIHTFTLAKRSNSMSHTTG